MSSATSPTNLAVDDASGRQVDRHRQVQALGAPGRRLFQSRLQDPMSERADEARLLRDRDELIGRDDPVQWMGPPQERLDADDATGAQLGFRLIVDSPAPRSA